MIVLIILDLEINDIQKKWVHLITSFITLNLYLKHVLSPVSTYVRAHVF
jgi:hypothetical protein